MASTFRRNAEFKQIKSQRTQLTLTRKEYEDTLAAIRANQDVVARLKSECHDLERQKLGFTHQVQKLEQHIASVKHDLEANNSAVDPEMVVKELEELGRTFQSLIKKLCENLASITREPAYTGSGSLSKPIQYFIQYVQDGQLKVPLEETVELCLHYQLRKTVFDKIMRDSIPWLSSDQQKFWCDKQREVRRTEDQDRSGAWWAMVYRHLPRPSPLQIEEFASQLLTDAVNIFNSLGYVVLYDQLLHSCSQEAHAVIQSAIRCHSAAQSCTSYSLEAFMEDGDYYVPGSMEPEGDSLPSRNSRVILPTGIGLSGVKGADVRCFWKIGVIFDNYVHSSD